MLIYHPAYDAYHCLFRMIALINNIDTIEIEKARILDFYLTFPSLVEKIRMPQNHSHIKKIAKKYFNDYRNPINSASVFQDMHQIQISAIRVKISATFQKSLSHVSRLAAIYPACQKKEAAVEPLRQCTKHNIKS